MDNLKLGYGGTKSEMERLIADANRVKEANGEMGDLSIDSFSDVIDAIAIMQEEMGIAGNAADEMEHTLTGSIGSMQAAWENFVMTLGDPDGDIETAIDNLVETTIAAMGNIIPEVSTIVANLVSAIREQFPQVAAAVVQTIHDALPESLQGAFEGVTEAVSGLIEDIGNSEALPLVTEAFSYLDDILNNIWSTVSDYLLPTIGEFNDTLNGLFGSLEPYLPVIADVFTAIGNVIVDIIIIVLDVIGIFNTFFTVVADGIVWLDGLWEQAKAAFGNFTSSISNGIDSVVSWFKGLPDRLLTAVGDIASKMSEIGSNIVSGIKSGLSGAWNDLTTWFSDKINGLVSGAKELLGIQSPSHVFRDQVGKQIAAGIRVGYEQNDPMKDINRSIGVRVDDIGMSVRSFSSGERAGGISQVINVNQPVATVDELARAARHEAMYGLVGAY